MLRVDWDKEALKAKERLQVGWRQLRCVQADLGIQDVAEDLPGSNVHKRAGVCLRVDSECPQSHVADMWICCVTCTGY